MSESIDISQGSKVNLDVKTLVGIIFLVLAMGGGYVTLQGQIAALQLDVVRLQDQQELRVYKMTLKNLRRKYNEQTNDSLACFRCDSFYSNYIYRC